MNDQQQPSGEWNAPDDDLDVSQSGNAGQTECDQSLTQPIPQPAEADEVSDQTQRDATHESTARLDDGGLDASAATPTPSAGSADPVWRDQYLRERKKSRLFMATTAVALLLLVGSLFYAVAQNQSTQLADLVAGRGPGGAGLEDGRHPGSTRPRGGEAQGREGISVDRLFNADGSVNEELIESLKDRAERFGGVGRFSGRIAAGIAGAVSSGEITQEQADELMAALDLDSSGGGI